MHVAVMKFVVFCLVVISIVYVYAEDKYTTKFDNINVDEILSNKRLLKRYVDCVLDKAQVRCPPEAVEIKNHVKEALQTECAKCSEKQKEIVEKVIKHLVQHEKESWEELKKKFDPNDEMTKKYEDLAKQKGIKI